jgi:hypothetical protein
MLTRHGLLSAGEGAPAQARGAAPSVAGAASQWLQAPGA